MAALVGEFIVIFVKLKDKEVFGVSHQTLTTCAVRGLSGQISRDKEILDPL